MELRLCLRCYVTIGGQERTMPNVQPSRLSRAVKQARENSGVTQAELARRMGVTQPQISQWETSREPDLDNVARIETGLELRRGAILRLAGYVENGSSVEEVIQQDASLSSTTRRLLLAALAEARRGR